MKDFLETTVGRIILGAIVLIIWVVNAFNFSQMGEEDNAVVSNSNIEFMIVSNLEKMNYTYDAISRDPFSRIDVVQTAKIIQNSGEEYQNIPDIQLNGIIGTSAMITLEGSEVIIIEPGEFISEEILLKRIFTDSIHIEIGDHQLTLIINQ
jgi:hypothetical protein